jgi:hypothetical protein
LQGVGILLNHTRELCVDLVQKFLVNILQLCMFAHKQCMGRVFDIDIAESA